MSPLPVPSRNDVLRCRGVKGDADLLVPLNLVHEPRKLTWRGEGDMMLSTYLDSEERAPESRLLRPGEGIIIRLRR